jgi:hypothetical protein
MSLMIRNVILIYDPLGVKGETVFAADQQGRGRHGQRHRSGSRCTWAPSGTCPGAEKKLLPDPVRAHLPLGARVTAPAGVPAGSLLLWISKTLSGVGGWSAAMT